MKIWETLEYKHEEGKEPPQKLTLFALSTCGFCKSALRFLRRHKVSFNYIFLDDLELDLKKEVKQQLKDTFGERPMYPFLLIGPERHLIGFDEDEWYEEIGLGSTTEEQKDSAAKELESPELAGAHKFVTMVADKQGWQLPSDKEFMLNLVKGLTKNKEKYGYYLCPCRIGEGVKRKDKDIICPCDYAKPDIGEYGHCFCALYLSKEFSASGKKPKSIPERRPEEK